MIKLKHKTREHAHPRACTLTGARTRAACYAPTARFLQRTAAHTFYFFFGPPNGEPISLPLSLIPMFRSILPSTSLFGIALPCSYSVRICGLMLHFVAKSFVFMPFAFLPWAISLATDREMVLCFNVSESRSNFAASIPPVCFRLADVSIAAPDRCAALTDPEDLEAPDGLDFRSTVTWSQSDMVGWVVCGGGWSGVEGGRACGREIGRAHV